MRAIVRATAMATAVALMLTGCSLWSDGEKAVTDIYSGVVAYQALTKLTDELNLRDDVESAESTVTPVEMTASVTVVLTAAASPQALADVATRVDEVLRSDAMEPFERRFSVQAGEAGIRQTSFDVAPVDFAAEISHWASVQSAVGAELSLELDASRTGGVIRIFSTRTDATVAAILDNYDELVALESLGGAETMWRLPGVAGNTDRFGPLPERSILSLLTDIADVTNLLDESLFEEPPGFFASLPDGFPPWFILVANAPDGALDAAATSQLILRVTQGAIATGLSAFRVSVQSYGADSLDTANFHVGECTDVNPPTAADRQLVADLVAAGVGLTADAAGSCRAFAGT